MITAENVGTQTGTNVVITDEFPADILVITDSDTGTVDVARGTITWSLDVFEVGQAEVFTIIAEVLPTASLDTADQLFTNSVSITDDKANGADPTPENNNASESDMLLAGAGEPLFLLAVPEHVSLTPVSSGTTAEFKQSPAKEVPNTARIITTDSMRGLEEGEGRRLRIAEDDVLSGGSLLDEFSLPAPEIHCAPHFVSYEYQSDPANLELLDWLQESGNQNPEDNVPEKQNGAEQVQDTHAIEAEATTVEDDTSAISQQEPVNATVQQQILREAENLYGSGRKELLEAFKDSV